MKNHVPPPVFTTELPVPFASAHVSYVQWIVLGEHALPVRSDDAAEETMNALPLSRVIWLTASATPELGTSRMRSTFSASYHWRAGWEPPSALFWGSANTISTFRPFAGAPEAPPPTRAAPPGPGPARPAQELDREVVR